MYAEDYDYDYPPPSRYSSRDYFYDEPPLRERDRDRLPFRGSSSLEDPYYSRPPREPLLSAPSRRKHSLMSAKYPDDYGRNWRRLCPGLSNYAPSSAV